jgi:hypothetical protein
MNNIVILLAVVTAILAVTTVIVVSFRANKALKANPEVRAGLPLGVPTSEGLVDLAKQGRPDWLYQERKDWQV